MTSPKETAPFHMLCMASPYPAAQSLAIIDQDRAWMSVPGAGTDTSSVVRISPLGNTFEWQIGRGGSMMSDMGLEAPDADAAEQQQAVAPEPADDEPEQLPLEASPADAAEQAREVAVDDDEYR